MSHLKFYESDPSRSLHANDLSSSGHRPIIAPMDKSDAEIVGLRRELTSLRSNYSAVVEERLQLAHTLQETEIELQRVRMERDELKEWYTQRFEDVSRSTSDSQVGFCAYSSSTLINIYSLVVLETSG